MFFINLKVGWCGSVMFLTNLQFKFVKNKGLSIFFVKKCLFTICSRIGVAFKHLIYYHIFTYILSGNIKHTQSITNKTSSNHWNDIDRLEKIFQINAIQK